MTKGPSESQFQAAVIEYAELRGWMVYHVANVKSHLRAKTSVGYPDLTMIRYGRLLFAELKRTAKDKPTEAQEKWLRELDCGCAVYVWRPSDWPEIERVLR